ncbi:MAG TPA: hypothetical protein VFD66_00865, partial [Verrucomicrobiae bacterium]|nr:hypothetical protein [Verrucomicrobiae bacterium]
AAMLVPISLLALILSWPWLRLNLVTGQLENLYGFLGLAGFVSFALLGMLYKIIPFLVWFGTYSPHVGRAQVPALADLYCEALQTGGYWSWLAGLVVTGAGIVAQNNLVVRCGALTLAVSMGFFVLNVAKILSHLFFPVLKPFPSRAAN